MKKQLVIGLVIILLSLGFREMIREPKMTVAAPDSPINFELTEKINNIAVPYDVLLDAQMEHPGHAVAAASKTRRDGKELYRLRLDSSDRQSSRTNIYLLYDMEWRLLGEEQTTTPAPKPPEPVAAPVPEPAPVPPVEEPDEEEDEVEDEEDEEEDDDEESEGPLRNRRNQD